jgi:hypothetical protein
MKPAKASRPSALDGWIPLGRFPLNVRTRKAIAKMDENSRIIHVAAIYLGNCLLSFCISGSPESAETRLTPAHSCGFCPLVCCRLQLAKDGEMGVVCVNEDEPHGALTCARRRKYLSGSKGLQARSGPQERPGNRDRHRLKRAANDSERCTFRSPKRIGRDTVGRLHTPH